MVAKVEAMQPDSACGFGDDILEGCSACMNGVGFVKLNFDKMIFAVSAGNPVSFVRDILFVIRYLDLLYH
jgi:hypothetical protein